MYNIGPTLSVMSVMSEWLINIRQWAYVLHSQPAISVGLYIAQNSFQYKSWGLIRRNKIGPCIYDTYIT